MPAGGEGKIKIKVATSGYGGRNVNKNITVTTNDQKNRQLKLTIGGHVENFVTITPNRVNLMGYAGQPLKAVVKIVPEQKYPFKITGTEAAGQQNISYILEQAEPGKDTGYILTVENSKKEKGRYYEVISLKTDSQIKPLIKIGVYGTIIEPDQNRKR
ncbi:MAG: hypothetical protein ISS65_13010 [Desulfobacterales bacterium]|uniref:DUF1573 domain-containing protein n=1 Tax=Candidatus Desulfatibia profunda TaxID=2841695 RepID=A0A8J6TM65_9BACT|nr:hypothetical protein [Candidatus Desulfatibia profunda]MBL7181106.1 hypothetical protein [Desulfobacterales bacterium]